MSPVRVEQALGILELAKRPFTLSEGRARLEEITVRKRKVFMVKQVVYTA